MHPLTHFRRNVVAYVALFAALGTGSAYAAGQIKSSDIAKNAVKSKHIKDGQVRGADLAADSVSGDKVAPNSITGADIDESTLQGLPIPAAAPAAPSQPVPTPSEPDLSKFPEIVAEGILPGAGPLTTADRCNSVQTAAPGVNFGDYVLLTPGQMSDEVVYTVTREVDVVRYTACYTGSTNVTISGDVRFLVLRTP